MSKLTIKHASFEIIPKKSILTQKELNNIFVKKKEKQEISFELLLIPTES